jgi:cysteinyl-tRNA synthetase
MNALTVFNATCHRKQELQPPPEGVVHLVLSDVPSTEEGLLQRLRMERVFDMVASWLRAIGMEPRQVSDGHHQCGSIALHGCLAGPKPALPGNTDVATENWMQIGVVKHCYTRSMVGSVDITPRLIVDAHDAEVTQLVMLRTHYRADLQFHKLQMEDSSRVLITLYRVLRDVEPDTAALDWAEPHASRFASALNDDFNTPRAFAVLYALADSVRATKSRALARQLSRLGAILGILGHEPHKFLEAQAENSRRSARLSALPQMKVPPRRVESIVHRAKRVS